MIISFRVVGCCLALVATLETFTLVEKAKGDEIYVDERFSGHPAIGTVLVGPPEVVPQWASLAEDVRRQLEDPPPTLAGVRDFAASMVESDGQADARRLVRAIRDYVTGQIEYVTDRPRDRWASPQETMEGGFGDCEDQAILGLYIALAAGVPPGRAAVAIGRDRRGRQHAILFVGDGDGRAFAFNIAEPGAVPLARSGFSPEILGYFNAVGVPRPDGAVRSLPDLR